MSEPFFDDLARKLASPMPRRRALRLVGAALAAAVLPGVRPRAASAGCGPDTLCADTCQDKAAGHVGGCGVQNKTGCGSQVNCRLSGGCMTKNDQCCRGAEGTAHEDAWICPKGTKCGKTRRDPCCPPKYQCGDGCCSNGQYCEKYFLGADFCDKICPTGHDKCNGVCCTENETCGIFGCDCTSGLVSTGGGTCVPPDEDPGNPKVNGNPLSRLVDMAGQSSAAHGGKHLARAEGSGSATVGKALDALAAVNGQGAAALLAVRNGQRDPAFKQKVSVARAIPPTLGAGTGLDASSVAALNKLLLAEARANALIAAMAKTLWRARAAHAGREAEAARNQLRASATFASQAVTALEPIQGLRHAAAAALTAGGVSEVLASDSEVRRFIASVRSHGFPATLHTPMVKLGVGSADFDRLSAAVLDQPAAAAAGPVLIAPLTAPERAHELKSLISELSKFSARARKHPIAR